MCVDGIQPDLEECPEVDFATESRMLCSYFERMYQCCNLLQGTSCSVSCLLCIRGSIMTRFLMAEPRLFGVFHLRQSLVALKPREAVTTK